MSTRITLLHEIVFLGDAGFLQLFRVVSSENGKPRFGIENFNPLGENTNTEVGLMNQMRHLRL